MITWSAEKYPKPTTYSDGKTTITLRAIHGSDEDLVQPVMIIKAAGHPARMLRGSEGAPAWDAKFGIGKFDSHGTPFVYFQTFTGGAHCCNNIQVALLGAAGVSVVDLGEWDGEPDDAFPKDEDADGVVDFVQRDNAFLYKYTSYAESMSPLQVLDIIGGRVVDVSARPSFRTLFVRDMASARQECLNPSQGGSPNGACAAYVASAARAGRFRVAWAEMLKSFQTPPEGWDLTECKIEPGPPDYTCPSGAEIRFDGFPQALRYFLVKQGYLTGNEH